MPEGETWPPRTRAWWKRWGASAFAEDMSALEWEELLIAAVLHARFWKGDTKAAAELRLRVAKFGVTPEDRLRLRISLAPRVTLATPDEPETKPGTSRSLRLVDV